MGYMSPCPMSPFCVRRKDQHKVVIQFGYQTNSAIWVTACLLRSLLNPIRFYEWNRRFPSSLLPPLVDRKRVETFGRFKPIDDGSGRWWPLRSLTLSISVAGGCYVREFMIIFEAVARTATATTGSLALFVVGCICVRRVLNNISPERSSPLNCLYNH